MLFDPSKIIGGPAGLFAHHTIGDVCAGGVATHRLRSRGEGNPIPVHTNL